MLEEVAVVDEVDEVGSPYCGRREGATFLLKLEDGLDVAKLMIQKTCDAR